MEEFINQNQEKIIELENYIKVHNSNKNALIMILHKAQSIFGYLPEEIQIYIAKKLHIPVAKVYGVVTFYSYFNMEKKGKYNISVCQGTACFVKGSEAVLNEFKRELKIEVGQATEDGLFALESVRCLGACGLAPVVSINGKIYGNVKRSEVAKILDEYKGLN